MKSFSNYVSTLVKSAFVVFAIIGFVSCKKNNNDDPAPPPVVAASIAKGYWTGHYTTTGFIGQTNYAILLKAGGVGRIYDLDAGSDTSLISPLAKPNATWVENGNNIEITYLSGAKVMTNTAVINPAHKTMIGTWARDGVVKGTISLTK